MKQIRFRGFLCTQDIMEITGISSRATVSHWTRRDEDPCPGPIGKYGSQFVYNEHDFMSWARRNKKIKNKVEGIYY